MNIVVVGGGAGGLELVTQLGQKLGKKGKAFITLVDCESSHLWKPLLHEVATGSLDEGVDALSYRAHAKNNYFDFQLGQFNHINREEKTISLCEILDDHGEMIVPVRSIPYDILVLSIGSKSNDFNTPGVRENCIFLDSIEQARKFRHEMNNQFLRLHGKHGDGCMNIAIVGAGATGVELSAELYNAIDILHCYGFGDIDSSKLNINLVEAGEKILPALPEEVSSTVHQELVKLGVNVRTKTMVTEATKDGLITKDGETIPAQLMVWAAGIKAPDFIKNIAGLETNRINQLVVKPTLQTTLDDNIFVIGDLASCPIKEGGFVPPRAQSAHQMASLAYKNIICLTKNHKELAQFVYKDYGSFISMSQFSTVGNLVTRLDKNTIVKGRLAKFVYVSLYRLHQIALYGYFKTLLIIIVGRINRVLKPSLKLH